MILDSSAVIAVLFREKEHEWLEERMAAADTLAIGAPTLFEEAMVAIGLYEARGHDLLAHFLEDQGVEVMPFDERHWEVAVDAFDRYGKGRHPAGLNLGDCLSYSSAQVARQSLLFIGNDFARTDIAPA
jgi:ribonuclease VapC